VFGDGTLWQVGSPAELLARPGNRRVAHSLCRPSPAWVEGSARAGPDGSTTFVSHDGSVTLPAPPAEPGRPLTLGVPAEALSPAPDGTSFARGQVALTEFVTGRWLVAADSPAGRLRLWWPGDGPPGVGDGLRLTVRPERLLWFDGPTGAAVGPDGG
jgi:ABC-type sugar transport system ATPase subunit